LRIKKEMRNMKRIQPWKERCLNRTVLLSTVIVALVFAQIGEAYALIPRAAVIARDPTQRTERIISASTMVASNLAERYVQYPAGYTTLYVFSSFAPIPPNQQLCKIVVSYDFVNSASSYTSSRPPPSVRVIVNGQTKSNDYPKPPYQLKTWYSGQIEFDINIMPSSIAVQARPGDYTVSLRKVVVTAYTYQWRYDTMYSFTSFIPLPPEATLNTIRISYEWMYHAATNGRAATINMIADGALKGSRDYRSPTNIFTSDYMEFAASAVPSQILIQGKPGDWEIILRNVAVIAYFEVPPPFDFNISSSQQSQSVSRGQKVTYLMTLTLMSGLPATVYLSVSGAPADTIATFEPQSGIPDFGSALTVTTTSNTPTGTHTLTITATGWALIRTIQVTLTVVAAPDFIISVSPLSQTVLQAKTATYLVSMTPLNGFSAPVTLNVIGLAADATYSFSPVTGWSSTLTANAGDTTGTFSLAVSATSTGITHTTAATLTVSIDPVRQASKEAIDAARDAINKAEREGRTEGLADVKLKLSEAEASHRSWEYPRAKRLAEEAKALAEKARSFIESYGLFIGIAIALAAIVIAVVMRRRTKHFQSENRSKP